jgi:hypothetical protein
MAPYHHVGVLHARSEHADPHLAPASRRQRSVDHLQPVGIAEAPDLDNPVAQPCHWRMDRLYGQLLAIARKRDIVVAIDQSINAGLLA